MASSQMHTCTKFYYGTVEQESLVGGKFGELFLFEHLVKESLAN